MTSFLPSPNLQSGPWLDQIQWNQQGLVPVIAQEVGSGDVLMMAWMNREALLASMRLGQAVYWSRSRKMLWHKGAESGHTQTIQAIGLDCDGDTLLLQVIQKSYCLPYRGSQLFFPSLGFR